MVQKLIEAGTSTQRQMLIDDMKGHVVELSKHTYGCRVVQKAIDYTHQDELVAMANGLRDDIDVCIKDQNANHVLQKLLETAEDPRQLDFIPKAFDGKVFALARHCYSCRVLQRVFENCEKEQIKLLLEEVHFETTQLMQDQYGNYVIQWLLQRKTDDSVRVIQQTRGQFVALSKHKFASNVLEIVVVVAKEMQPLDGRPAGAYFKDILEEILTEPPQAADGGAAKESPASIGAVQMMNHSYANYVLQQILNHADEEDKRKIASCIRPELARLRQLPNRLHKPPSIGHAKHLIAVEKLIEGY